MKKENNEQQETLLSKAMLGFGDLGYAWNMEMNETNWFGSAHGFLGFPSSSPLNIDALIGRINPQDLPVRMKLFHDSVENEESFSCEYRLRTGEGQVIWVHETGFVNHVDGQKTFFGVLRDITEDKQALTDLKVLAYINTSTSLPNREGFRLLVEEEIDYIKHAGKTGTLFSVGIDRLNIIEEAYGTAVTEEIFRKVAHRLDHLIESDGKTGVLSGDAFGLIMPGVDEKLRRQKAFDIIRNFSENPVLTEAGPLRVTVSIGSIGIDQHDFTAHGFIKRADMAMNHAREKGQGGYHLYNVDASERDAFREWIVTGEQFVKAMKQNRISLAFQKVINHETNEPFFYEALIRMIDEEGNIIPAGLFIPAVEKMGLVRMADMHAVRLVIKELEEFKDIRISVNISALTMMDDEWLDQVKTMLEGQKEVAERLIVEITETSVMHDIEQALNFITELHGLGCKVALDDFGAGQTSFSQLDKLPIDIVKIDRSFVHGITEKEQNKLFVRSLHMLAQGFGLQTVAEGVEEMEEAEILKAEGIQNMQGWAFDKPVTERTWLPEDHPLRQTATILPEMTSEKISSRV